VIERKWDKLILDEKKVNMEKLQKKLRNYFLAYYKGLTTNNDEDFPLMETNFYLHVKKSLALLKKSGYKLELRKREKNFEGKQLKEGIKIFERFHIMGLNVERAKNSSLENYEAFRDEEINGLVGYYYKRTEDYGIKIENKQVEHFPNDGKLYIKPHKQLILRTYVQYTSPDVLHLTHNGKDVSEDLYTFQHVGVFENQLRAPPVGSTMFHPEAEWLALYRLQNWKLVDFDGLLHGNPHVVDKTKWEKLLLAVPNEAAAKERID